VYLGWYEQFWQWKYSEAVHFVLWCQLRSSAAVSTGYGGQWDLIGKLATKALAQTAPSDGNAAANSSSSLWARFWVMVLDSGVRVTYLAMFVWFPIFFVIRPFFWFILSKREECHRFGCLTINDTIKSLRYIKSLLCQLISSLSDYQPKMCARWIPIQHFSAHWVYFCSSTSSCASSSLPPAVPAVEMVEPRLNLIWLLNQRFRSSCAMSVQ